MMKQHITPKQARMVSRDFYYSLFTLLVKRDDWADYHHKKATVAHLLSLCVDRYGFSSVVKTAKGFEVTTDRGVFTSPVLVDALWSVVLSEFEESKK